MVMLKNIFQTLAMLSIGKALVNEHTIDLAFAYLEEITMYLLNSLMNWAF